jgi:translation initiation factor IF-2
MTLESKPIRLSILARELNVGTATIIEFLAKKGYSVENNPNAKVPVECMDILDEEFKESKSLKEKAIKNTEKAREKKLIFL